MRIYDQTVSHEAGAGWLPRPLIAAAVQATYDASLGDTTFPQLLDTLREAVYRDMAYNHTPATRALWFHAYDQRQPHR